MKCINSANPEGNAKAKAGSKPTNTGKASEKKTEEKTGK